MNTGKRARKTKITFYILENKLHTFTCIVEHFKCSMYWAVCVCVVCVNIKIAISNGLKAGEKRVCAFGSLTHIFYRERKYCRGSENSNRKFQQIENSYRHIKSHGYTHTQHAARSNVRVFHRFIVTSCIYWSRCRMHRCKIVLAKPRNASVLYLMPLLPFLYLKKKRKTYVWLPFQ